MAYKYDGKANTASFGPYPLVSLKQAREKREELQKLLLQNINPKQLFEEKRIEQLSFRKVGEEWYGKNEPA